MMRPARVLVVDAHDVVVAGLTSVLDRDPGIHVVGVAHSCQRAHELADVLAPDVLVMGHGPRDSGDIGLCRQIVESHPDVGVMVLSLDSDDSSLQRCLHAGARGFLHMGISAKDLRSAVKAVARGEAVLDPKVAGRVMGWVRHQRSHERKPLSRRETQVLRLVSLGASDRRIAKELGLSPNTVKTYLRRSLDKLGCDSRSEAAARAAARGLA